MEKKKQKLLEQIENHKESFEEVSALLFTDKMKQKKYSNHEQELILKNFLILKKEAVNAGKVLCKTSYMSAVVLYRILNKTFNIEEKVYMTFNRLIDLTDVNVAVIKNRNLIMIDFPWEDFKDNIEDLDIK